MRAAYRQLRSPERDLIGHLAPKTRREFKRALRVDVLSYASDRCPGDRELYRRLISAIHDIPLRKISFAGEGGLATADYAWDVKPEEREPVDILAPRKYKHISRKQIEEWLGSIDFSHQRA
jgi:hypothetical protein